MQKYCLSHVSFGSAADWTLWSTLRELKIRLDLIRVFDNEMELLKILSCLPRLENLGIDQGENPGSLVFTLEHFELLHQHLPQLRDASLALELDAISNDDLRRIRSTTPAKNLVTFNLSSDVKDNRWLCYFAQKYPNLSVFNWILIKNDNIQQSSNDAVSIFSGLPYAFPNLSAIQMYTEEDADLQHFLLWKLFRKFKVPLNNLKYTFSASHDSPELLPTIIHECTHSLSSTLTTLTIITAHQPAMPRDISAYFDYCIHLINLNLVVADAQVSIDVLLTQCPSLIRLRLSGVTLSVGSEGMKQQVQHKLRMLQIAYKTTTANTFNYISLHCRQLKYMNLTDVLVTGSISPETGSLCLSMPHTHFEILHMHGVRFCSSNNGAHHGVPVNFIVLSQPTAVLQKPKPTKLIKTFFSGKPTTKRSIQYTWFHIFSNDIKLENDAYLMRVLDNKEAKYAKNYFRQFRRNTSTISAKVERSYHGQLTMCNWKHDLSQGYVNLMCAYIGECSVGYKNMFSKTFWSELAENI
ncbi:hypothetical protein F4703DRAFT_1881633 [Phycomyces blakesleeanus]